MSSESIMSCNASILPSDWLLLWQRDRAVGHRRRRYHRQPAGGGAHVLQRRPGEGKGLHLPGDRAGEQNVQKQTLGEKKHANQLWDPSNSTASNWVNTCSNSRLHTANFKHTSQLGVSGNTHPQADSVAFQHGS